MFAGLRFISHVTSFFKKRTGVQKDTGNELTSRHYKIQKNAERFFFLFNFSADAESHQW